MAGDWLKWSKGFGRKREVLACASKLGVHRRHVAGLLMEVFEWADDNTTDGHVKGATASDIDAVVDCPGTAAVLVDVGWLRITEKGVTFVNFDRHNGQTAKTRALTSVRVKRNRNASKGTKTVPLFSSLLLPFSSSEFLSAWEGFCEYRARKSGKGWTKRAESMVLAKLEPWGEAKAIQALNQAIERSWTTVFEPKEDAPKGGSAWDKIDVSGLERR